VEMFGGLSWTERGQIWGLTLPLQATGEASRELVLERFDELLSVLEERAIRRLGAEREPRARENIYRFPHELESLRGPLAELLLPLLAENPYQDTPLLRGLYLTSATQQGHPSQPYFLHELFSEVMFRDRSLAGPSSELAHRHRVLHHAAAGGVLLLVLGLGLLLGRSFAGNLQLLSTAERAGRVWQEEPVRPEATSALSRLVPLRELLQELEAHEAHGVPPRLRFGLYQGQALLPAVRTLYAGAVRKLLVEPMVTADARELRSLLPVLGGTSGREPSAEEFVRAFRLLEHHLLLTGNRSPEEPVPTPEEQAVLVQRLVEHARDGPLAGADPALLASHARLYVSLVARHPELASRRRTRLVELARAAVHRSSLLP
jgi:type VI secretion system protein ImpL